MKGKTQSAPLAGPSLALQLVGVSVVGGSVGGTVGPVGGGSSVEVWSAQVPMVFFTQSKTVVTSA